MRDNTEIPFNRTISPHDDMMDSFDEKEIQTYFAVGQSALENIKTVLALVGKTEVRKILDLPCGYGRVLRMIHAAFPRATIHACDLNKDAVDFCAATFGAIPVYSSTNFREISLEAKFDLIWSGSLLTHLDAKQFAACIEFYIDRLADGGVLLFSTHGRYSAWLQQNAHVKYLGDDRFQQILADYEQSGFGYQDYEGQINYGISITKPSWVVALLEGSTNIRIVHFFERSWSNHQDIFACIRLPMNSVVDIRLPILS